MNTLRFVKLGLAGLASLALVACGGETDGQDATESTETATDSGTVTVTDLRGEVEVPAEPKAIVATDNRIFRSLEDWGVELVAAPLPLLLKDSAYASTEGIIDLGSHREPNLEGIVEAQPDLILNGQRFATEYDTIKSLAGDAAIVDINIDSEKPLDEELRRQITLLGEVLGHQDEATELVGEFDAAIEAATDAYDPEWTVMGLLTSGGDISYSAPGTGRAVGPVFDMVGLTPALEQEATDTTHGDDISVEAIAQSNPDWIIVLDRDAATEEGEFSTAEELIAESEALKSVTAVQKNQIIYLDANFYKTEDIQAYTALLNDMAEAFSAN